jgi:N-acetyl-anhydromuramyl-L-alanine amidase AmpD
VKFIQAKHFTTGGPDRKVDLLVLHSMESSRHVDTAEVVAQWFAGPNAPQASAHFCVDANSIVQCVRLQDVGWHAPGANHNGIGFEHAGRAAQSRAEWLDDYGRAMLELSARLASRLCRQFRIPPVFVGAAELKLGTLQPDGSRKPARGITTHVATAQAFRKSTHTDPGPGFPLDWYVSRVVALMTEANPLSARPEISIPI